MHPLMAMLRKRKSPRNLLRIRRRKATKMRRSEQARRRYLTL